MTSQKVYIIEEASEAADPARASAAAQRRHSETPRREPGPNLRTPKMHWITAVRAYGLGPLSLIIWPRERKRGGWAVASAVSVALTGLLAVEWTAYWQRAMRFEHGPAIWAASVAVVILAVTTVWSRAVATSPPFVAWPRRLRSIGSIGVLGLMLPGLGLLIAGRRWRAALAVWSAGLLAAAAVVVLHWRSLAAVSAGHDIGAEAGAAAASTEIALIVAGICAGVGLLAWLVQALDGVRVVSPFVRSNPLANRLALALLASLGLLVATFQPVFCARHLSAAATRLREHRLRLIPLALCEAAASLDPSEPSYLVEAASLCEALGRADDAAEKRAVLRRRAEHYAGAVGAELVAGAALASASAADGRRAAATDRLWPHALWWIEPNEEDR
jgi:hypothetical protein